MPLSSTETSDCLARGAYSSTQSIVEAIKMNHGSDKIRRKKWIVDLGTLGKYSSNRCNKYVIKQINGSREGFCLFGFCIVIYRKLQK